MQSTYMLAFEMILLRHRERLVDEASPLGHRAPHVSRVQLPGSFEATSPLSAELRGSHGPHFWLLLVGIVGRRSRVHDVRHQSLAYRHSLGHRNAAASLVGGWIVDECFELAVASLGRWQAECRRVLRCCRHALQRS